MMHLSDEAAELRRRTAATLHARSSPVPFYQKVVLAVVVLGALIGLIGVLFFR